MVVCSNPQCQTTAGCICQNPPLRLRGLAVIEQPTMALRWNNGVLEQAFSAHRSGDNFATTVWRPVPQVSS